MNRERSEIIAMLDERSLLGLLGDHAFIDQILTQFPPVAYKEGEIVIREDDEALGIVIPTTADLQIMGKDSSGNLVNFGSLQAGRAANLYAAIRGLPFQHTFATSNPCEVLIIPWEATQELLKKNPILSNYLFSMTERTAVRNLAKEVDDLGCSKFFRVKLLGTGKYARHEPDSWMLRQGQKVDSVVVILEGDTRAYQHSKDGKITSVWSPSPLRWFFWAQVLSGTESPYSFKSASPVRTYELSRDQLESLKMEFPEDYEKYSSWVAKSRAAENTGQEENEEAELNTIFYEPLKNKHSTRWTLPWVAQNDQMDCGAACMAMLSKYFGNPISVNYWRQQLKIDREGVSIFDLAQAAEKNGLIAQGIYVESLDHLDPVMLPVLVLRRVHFMVLYEVGKNYVTLGDPATGIQKISKKEFDNGFEKAAILIRPTDEFFNIKTPSQPYLPYLQLFKGYGREIAMVWICSVVIMCLEIFPPFLSQLVIDEVLSKKDQKLLLFIFGVGGTVLLCRGTLNYLRSYYLTYVSAKLDFKAASSFYRKMFSLPYDYFSTRHVGDFTRRLNEMERLWDFVMNSGFQIVLSLASVVVYSIALAVYSPTILFMTLAQASVFVIIAMFFSKSLGGAFNETFRARVEQESLTSDCIGGISAIKTLGGELAYRWRLEERVVKTLLSRREFYMKSSLLRNLVDAYDQIARLVIMVVAAYFAIQNGLSPGKVVSIMFISGSIISPFHHLSQSWGYFQELKQVIGRLNDIFLAKSDTTTSAKRRGRLTKTRLRGEIEFRDVWFRYGGEGSDWIVKGASFRILPGQSVAIVGPSGCGKSTISMLLGLFYEPTKGQILIDGRDFRDYDLEWLRSQLGFVLQESHLFFGSIMENIAATTPEINEQRAIEAAKLANAHSFISKKPQGYDYQIMYGGMGLSGGEKQRIAMARVLYRKPSLLILDEATASVDGISERMILQSIRALAEKVTIINIAHRYTTAKASDYALVMNEGRIIAFGSHQELQKSEPLYRDLFGLDESLAETSHAQSEGNWKKA